MKKTLLMGHIVAGFPDFQKSLDSALGIALGGASFLEVQFPFSDPNADGEIIRVACETSLNANFNTDLGFEFLRELQAKFLENNAPTKLLIMTYGNILFSYGIERFLSCAKECKIFGLIVPDLSLQNDENLFSLSKKFGLENIALIAPYTPKKRIKQLVENSGKFVYVVARNGITGDRTQISTELLAYIKHVKKYCNKPIALGFGLQNKEQISQLKGVVDIVVVGSAFVKHISTLKTNFKESLIEFTQQLQEGL
ncbi:MAG: tryptophan synthase subunit alpha [Helicobacter sp.]|nr:tryptophan synthase subunit alpha [Helicobacter sp.]